LLINAGTSKGKCSHIRDFLNIFYGLIRRLECLKGRMRTQNKYESTIMNRRRGKEITNKGRRSGKGEGWSSL
jgi:hypothetical protein